MIDVESLETLSTMLGVKSRIVEADIKDLAWVWEETLSQAKFADPRLAFYVLRAVSRSYLPGARPQDGQPSGSLATSVERGGADDHSGQVCR